MTGRHARCDLGSCCGSGLGTTPDHAGVTLVEHGGGVKGVAAQFMLVPERGLTAVGLANLAGAPTGRVVLGAVNAFLGVDPAAPTLALPDVPGEDRDPAALVGRYTADEGGHVDVAWDGATLTFASAGERSVGRRVGERAYAIVTDGHDAGVRFLTLEGETAVQSGMRVLRRPAQDAANAAQTGGR